MEENMLNIPYWNRKHLTPPKMISKSLICKHPSKVCMKLMKLFKGMLSEVEEVSTSLNTDAALLSRLVYRMKRVFRHDKTLQDIQKIKKCLSNLLSIDLLSTIKELDICTYDENGPTKEMFQWTMLSLQRLTALLHALINRCNAAVPALKGKIDSGHHWNMGVIILGVVARIWLLSRHLSLKSCEWYKNLNEFSTKTSVTNENLMLSTHYFPQDLSVWLGQPSYLQEKSNEVMVFSAMITDESGGVLEEELGIEGSEQTETGDVTPLHFKEDLGNVISREQLEEFMFNREENAFKDDVKKYGKKAGNFEIGRKMNHLINIKKHPDKWKTAKKSQLTLGNKTKKSKKK